MGSIPQSTSKNQETKTGTTTLDDKTKTAPTPIPSQFQASSKVCMVKQLLNKHFLGILLKVVVEALVKVRGMIFLMILTRYMGLSEYGIWSQINITISSLFPFITMQLPVAVIRFYHHDRYGCSRSFFTLLLICVGLNALLASFLLANKETIAWMLFNDVGMAAYVLPMLLLLAIYSLNNLAMSFFLGANHFMQYCGMQIVSIFSELAITSLGLIALGLGLLQILYILMVVNVIFFAFQIYYLHRYAGLPMLDTNFNIDSLRQYFRFSLPLVPHVLFTWAIGYSDRFFMLHFHDMKTVGLYNAVYTIAYLMLIVQLCFNYVVFPTVAKQWETQQERMEALNFTYMQLFGAVAMPGALTLLLLGPIIMHLMKIHVDETIMATLAITIGAFIIAGLDQFFRNMLQLSLRTAVLPLISFSAALANLLFNFLLIPWLGILGGAIATFCTYFVQFIFVIIAVNRIKDFRPELGSLGRSMAVLGTLGVVAFLCGRGLSPILGFCIIPVLLTLSLLYVHLSGKLNLKLINEMSND